VITCLTSHQHPSNPPIIAIINPISCLTDPFADAIKGNDDDIQDGLVHIRIQQRNGRKTLTTVQGLSAEYDLKKIVRSCKKVGLSMGWVRLTSPWHTTLCQAGARYSLTAVVSEIGYRKSNHPFHLLNPVISGHSP